MVELPMVLPVNIPLPTLKRFSFYLTFLLKKEEEDKWISTSDISRNTGVKPITIRKDLGYLGVKGIPQKGFPLDVVVSELKSILGGDSFKDVVLVGTWGFGSVYKNHSELLVGDFNLRVVFDFVDKEDLTGEIPVYPITRLKELIPRLGVSIAMLSVEPNSASHILEKLHCWGIKGVLNLTSRSLTPPDGCHMVKFNPLSPVSELLGLIKS